MAWNKPSTENQQQKKPSAKAPSAKRGIIAGAVVVALGALCLWMLSGNSDEAAASTKRESGFIKEVVPAATSSNAVLVTKKPIDPREDYDHEKCYRDEKGVLRYKSSGGRAYDKAQKHRKAVDLYDESKQTFHYRSERYIQSLLGYKPGSDRRFSPIDVYSEDFLEDFKKSLEEPIIIGNDELEFYKRRKRAMNEVKIEICDRMRNGEKLGDILTETKKELTRLNEYKRTLVSTVEEEVAKGEMSDADLNAFFEAANKMLKEKGITPIRKSQFLEWNVKTTVGDNAKPKEAK